VAVATVVLAVLLATGQRSVGFVSDPSSQTLEYRLVGGERVPVLALVGPGGQITVTPGDIAPEPDIAHNRMREFDRFLQRQTRLYDALADSTLGLRLISGESVDAVVNNRRPLGDIHWSFWLQLACGGLGLIIGVAVWAFRQTEMAASYYALTGIGLWLSASAAAIYSTRELALPGTLFNVIHAVNSTGTLLFTAGFTATLAYYPARLADWPIGRILVGVYVTVAALLALRWVPSFDVGVRVPVLAGFVLAIALAILQWRRARLDPVGRAALRWFLFSWFFGSSLFVALVFIPVLFGLDVGAVQGPAFALLLIIHLSLAIGISRYGLFRLEQHWSRILTIAGSGLAICLVDVTLVWLLDLGTALALGVSLAVVGWLYFPFRQWAWEKGLRSNRRRPALVRMVTSILSRPDEPADQAWSRLLQQAFSPGDIRSGPQGITDAIVDDGLRMQIAADVERPALELNLCDRGARLFRRDDLWLLADLRDVFAAALGYRERLIEGVGEERERVARDLHDDVGARLLTLSYRLQGEDAEQVRQALGELRSVIYSMRAGALSLADLLGEWRAEAVDRCEMADAVIEWVVYGEPPPQARAGGEILALTRLFREVLTNALKHAAPSWISVTIQVSQTHLACRVEHAYEGPEPAEWRANIGLHNLRYRADQLGGDIQWSREPQTLVTRWAVPLQIDEADAMREAHA
jgi:signal transduction histidine kinase